MSCGCSISQKAVLAAPALDAGMVETMVSAYRERRDVAYRILSEHGVRAFLPRGAFYSRLPLSRIRLGHCAIRDPGDERG